jgi:hypothetical protein
MGLYIRGCVFCGGEFNGVEARGELLGSCRGEAPPEPTRVRVVGMRLLVFGPIKGVALPAPFDGMAPAPVPKVFW